jgi:pimeloyl-ACP methyl ester carboxylesterase
VGIREHVRDVGALLGLGIACGVGPSCINSTDHPNARTLAITESDRGEVRRMVFASGGHEFDAVVHGPLKSARNGWGVVLVGGGMGNDLDWTVPGTIEANGSRARVTIDGRTHADAPILSSALVEQGFTVLRWSTIARGDPLADQWPVRATPRSLAELMEQTRAAIGAIRREAGIATDRIVLVGHSLGAARACSIAAEDSGVRGLVLLAPAYFKHDAKAAAKFEEAGMRFGEEVARERGVPCLAVFGAMDASRVVDADHAKSLAGKKGYERLEVRIIDGVGHQLGPQRGDLVGPMSAEVAGGVARWARDAIKAW